MAVALEPADEDFLLHAPQRYVFAMDLPDAPERVWQDTMAGPDALHFVRGLRIRWTSAAPFGLGSTRTARVLLGAVTLHERYFVWDEGRRNAFTGTSVSVPLFRRFAEDYRLEPAREGCRFTWTVAVEPRGPRAAAAVNDVVQRAMFAGMARDMRRHHGG